MGNSKSTIYSEAEIAAFHEAVTDGNIDVVEASIEAAIRRNTEMKKNENPKAQQNEDAIIELLSRTIPIPEKQKYSYQLTTLTSDQPQHRSPILVAIDSDCLSASIPGLTGQRMHSPLSKHQTIIALLLKHGGTNITGESTLWRSLVTELTSNSYFIFGDLTKTLPPYSEEQAQKDKIQVTALLSLLPPCAEYHDDVHEKDLASSVPNCLRRAIAMTNPVATTLILEHLLKPMVTDTFAALLKAFSIQKGPNLTTFQLLRNNLRVTVTRTLLVLRSAINYGINTYHRDLIESITNYFGFHSFWLQLYGQLMDDDDSNGRYAWTNTFDRAVLSHWSRENFSMFTLPLTSSLANIAMKVNAVDIAVFLINQEAKYNLSSATGSDSDLELHQVRPVAPFVLRIWESVVGPSKNLTTNELCQSLQLTLRNLFKNNDVHVPLSATIPATLVSTTEKNEKNHSYPQTNALPVQCKGKLPLVGCEFCSIAMSFAISNYVDQQKVTSPFYLRNLTLPTRSSSQTTRISAFSTLLCAIQQEDGLANDVDLSEDGVTTLNIESLVRTIYLRALIRNGHSEGPKACLTQFPRCPSYEPIPNREPRGSQHPLIVLFHKHQQEDPYNNSSISESGIVECILNLEGRELLKTPCSSRETATIIRILTAGKKENLIIFTSTDISSLSECAKYNLIRNRARALGHLQWEYIRKHESFYMEANELINNAGSDATVLLPKLVDAAYKNDILLIKYLMDECNLDFNAHQDTVSLLKAVIAGFEPFHCNQISYVEDNDRTGTAQSSCRPQRWRHVIPNIGGNEEYLGAPPKRVENYTGIAIGSNSSLEQPLPIPVFDLITLGLNFTSTTFFKKPSLMSLQRLCSLRMLLKAGASMNVRQKGPTDCPCTTPLMLAVSLCGVEMVELILNRRLAGPHRQRQLMARFTCLVADDPTLRCPLPTLYEPVELHPQTCDVNTQREDGRTALHMLVDLILQHSSGSRSEYGEIGPSTDSSCFYTPHFATYSHYQLHVFDMLSLLVADMRCDLKLKAGGRTALEMLDEGLLKKDMTQASGGFAHPFARDCSNMLRFFEHLTVQQA